MRLFILAVSILTSTIVFAQKGTIRGTISTADGKPAESVTISIKESTRGAVADKNGNYEIRNINAGTYKLIASFVGLQTQEQPVTIKAGETVDLDFVLKESADQLQEVIVSARRGNAKSSDYVSKMPLKAMENPQVYNTVSSELIKQQAITTYDDALKNAPGIHRLWESTGRGGDGASYYTLRGFEAQVSMMNGLPGLTNGNLDPANIEKIEVIKGPSGTLFGSSVISYGGLINNVTKKPYNDFGGEIGYIGGSFGLNRITADINAPLNKEKGILARINTAYQSENSFQDQGFRKSFFIAPTISYKVNDKLGFLLVTEFMQEEKTNPLMIFLGRDSKLQFTDLEDLNYNKNLSLTSNDLSIKNPRYNLQAQGLYKLSSKWTSQTVIGRGQSNSDGYYTYLYDNENGERDFGLWGTKELSHTSTSDIQQNFIGDFSIGTMRNRIVAGLDFFERKVNYAGTGWAWIHNVNAQGEINYVDPATGDEVDPVYLTRQSVDNLLAGTGQGTFGSSNRIYSAYASDVLNIIPSLLVMASLRVDHFDSDGDPDYDQTALSPKFGLVYQPILDKVSLFANYMNGFRNIAPSQVFDIDGNPLSVQNFEPEHANQFEGGVKLNLLAGKLSSTVSYYDIKVANQTMPDPQNPFNTIQGGKSRSRGIEVDVNAYLTEGLTLTAGYAYNYSNVLKGELENIWFEEGKRPIWAGPENLVNLWASYTLQSGNARGLGVGFGGNYASDNATLNNTLTGVFIIPSYAVINGSVFYNTSKFRLSLNVNNIGNKDYYGGGWSTVNPQKPRNIAAGFAYKF